MRAKHGPEYKIQTDLIEFLRIRGWLVERIIGNAFQSGLPDLFLHHPKWGSRWLDVKNPGRYSFTKAQRWKWPLWQSFGLGIWILTAATQEEYDKLFAPPNWTQFIKKSWKLPTQDEIDKLLEEIE